MSDSENPIAPLPAADASTAPAREAPPPSAQRRGTALTAVVLLVVAVVGLYAGWRWWTADQGERDAAQDEQRQLAQRIESLARGSEQARRETDTLRARLEDAAKVNQSLREQLLGLTERTRLAEEALANLADRRVSGHDALLLNEAEILLTLGAERFRLFHDAQGTIDAYHLADAALASTDDAAFSTVRQSISAELDAFGRLPDAGAALAALAQLRAAAPGLPAPVPGLAAEPDGSRWLRLLGQFVRVRHDDGSAAPRHEVGLARQLFTLDLRDAEAALLANDAARFGAALADASRVLGADFDAASPAVTAAAAQLDELRKVDVAPAPPNALGAALKELRNLRATHAERERSGGAVKPAEDRS